MKALLAMCALAFSSYVAVAAPIALGRLTNYYHDRPASIGPQAGYLRTIIKRALRGDNAAMGVVIMHRGIFSTGNNEGYSEVPQALLDTLGDDRYAAFVIRQPQDVQELALAVYPNKIPGFDRTFSKTAKLYHERFGR